MLRNLSRLLTPAAATETGLPQTDPASDLVAQQSAALASRAAADAAARAAQAALRGLRAPQPDPARAETWAFRPTAWHQAAHTPHLVGPASGTEIAPGLSVFHDCPLSESCVRQTLAPASAPAPFGITFDILRFEGSFLSLCLHLADTDVSAWAHEDIIRIALVAQMETPIALYGRLNLVQGPNTQQMLAHFPFETASDDCAKVAFDLSYAGLEPDPLTGAWIDLIFEKPAMNAVHLHDMRLSRGKRADL
ncbi:DUF6478 family protein [Tropicimonas sp. S265A]|uniref:DUF6478 family protein n=1 Tax=Tropicimonas sp. S265A TaxID=3415134 RepID=UPI003C7EA19A